MKKQLLAAALAVTASVASADVKVGMITTLSGGGAGLGIDVRDGFLLALKESGSDIELVIEDDHYGIGEDRCNGLRDGPS